MKCLVSYSIDRRKPNSITFWSLGEISYKLQLLQWPGLTRPPVLQDFRPHSLCPVLAFDTRIVECYTIANAKNRLVPQHQAPFYTSCLHVAFDAICSFLLYRIVLSPTDITVCACLQMLSLQFPPYATHGAQWLPQYIVPAPTHLPTVEDGYLPQQIGGPYKSDGQPARGISVMLPSPETAVQYNHMIPSVS